MATRLPLLKREERRFDEQYFKGVGTGASLGYHNAWNWNCNRRRSRSSSQVISGLFKSKKMKEARTLTGEQDRMFASAASAKRRAG
jgi:hypothetical protein